MKCEDHHRLMKYKYVVTSLILFRNQLQHSDILREPEAAPVVRSSKGGSERLKSSNSSLVTAIFILSIYIMRNNR